MIYVLAFDPIRIYSLNAFQNDRRNLSFVKHINVVGNKMTINGRKMTISKSCIFFNRTEFTACIQERLMVARVRHIDLWSKSIRVLRK